MDGWTVKLTAAFILTLSGAALGRSLAASRRLRVLQLENLEAGLDALSQQMLGKFLPLREALCRAGDPAFCALSEKLVGGRSAAEAWRLQKPKLSARGARFSALSDEEMAALDAFFDELGVSGLAEQRLLFSKTRETLRVILMAARKKSEEQGKLYGALGLLLGLGLSILLL